jgi:CheY-like chemotaxis protein
VRGDERIGSEQLLQHVQVPGPEGGRPEPIYVLGSFERRVTLYAQQVRALNLAFALFDTGRLKPGATVAVIGGGASGLTAAIGLAHLGASVHLIERTDMLMALQRSCRTRWIHPHIYDWPEPGADNDVADLPLVGWRAGYAHDVAETLDAALENTHGRQGSVQCSLSAHVANVTGGATPRVSWQGLSPAGRKIIKTNEPVDAVVVSVGFGVEDGSDELPMSSYWRNDDLDQPVLKRSHDRVRCLVSGNGDGGLIEVLRLRLRNFRLEYLHRDLRDNLPPADLERLTSQVRGWEREAAQRDDAWLWRQYDSLEVPEAFVEHVQRKLLRSDTQVYLAAARAPITFRSAVLNRLWVALLVKHDPATEWIQSATTKVTKHGTGSAVTFSDEAAAAGHDATFRRVILRHGPSHAFTGALQWIHQRCEAVFRARNALDQTRWPIWEEHSTFGVHGAAMRSTAGELVKTVAVDAESFGGNALAAPVVDAFARGALVAEGSPTPSPAPPRPTVAGLPPIARPPSIAGLIREPRLESAAPMPAMQRGAAGGFIAFTDTCRVDLESVGTAALRSGSPAPELRWHRSLQRPLDRIAQSAERIDSVANDPAGSDDDHERDPDVPAFKQSFFHAWERLGAAQREIQQGFQAMWAFLVDAPVESRTAAVRTFASLAALRMMARLAVFEGMLRTDDGQPIVNLFPDLPPITSSWLLRRIPYRSRVGGVALDEERFLLCRISENAQDYRYFLLPGQVAQAAQDRREGLPRAVIAQWIVPQWFFQRYEGTPGAPQIVGTLVDEYGRERHMSGAPAPWRGERELEEKPHLALLHGAKLHELGDGWDVLVLPHDAGPGAQLVARQPLAGKCILWVDDNPSNIHFEISLLEQLGTTVSYATTTELALAEITKHQPDLVISDIVRVEHGKRVGRAGLELHQQMQARAAAGAAMPPVIFYTGNQQRAPVEIREIAADGRAALFALIDAKLGARM